MHLDLSAWISVFTAAISFVGLLLVVLQLRDATRQRRLESVVEVFDINRQLIALGFEYPDLFAVLEDKEGADPARDRRYLQLWLNQLALIHEFSERGALSRGQDAGLKRDLKEFMTHRNMRGHWDRYGRFYSPSFQALVAKVIVENNRPA